MTLHLGIQTSMYALESGGSYEYAGEADPSDANGKNHLDTAVSMIRTQKVSSQLRIVTLCFIDPIEYLYISIVPQTG